jgi:hypothetical protein
MRKATFIGDNANFKKYLNAMRLWLALSVNTTHRWCNPNSYGAAKVEDSDFHRGDCAC